MTAAELLTHIFASYCLVDAKNITKEEQKVFLIVCNLNDPPVIVCNAVEELVDLSKAGNVPKTQSQILSLFLLDWYPCTYSMLIFGLWSSNPRTEAIVTLDSVPLICLMRYIISHVFSSCPSPPTAPPLTVHSPLTRLMPPPPPLLRPLVPFPPSPTISYGMENLK